MKMPKKIIPAISIIFVTGLALVFFLDVNTKNENNFEGVFMIDALYNESQGNVLISFVDESQKTTKVTLEILGMEKSFQKSFEGSSFVENVTFGDPPKYGWKAHPITLNIEHEDFGNIGLKTEIHSLNDPIPPVIFSVP